MGQQRQLALQICYDLRLHEDLELLAFHEVGAASELADEHIKQEAAFIYELGLRVSDTLF